MGGRGWAAPLACGLAVLGLALAVRGAPPRIDPLLRDGVLAHRSPALTSLARAVTALGTGPVVYGVLLAAAAAAVERGRLHRRDAAGLVAALAAGQVVRLAASEAVGRARPPRSQWLAGAAGHAFPSGHTTTATLGYGLACLLAVRVLAAWPARAAAVVAAVVLAAGVGASRVYLGVHWPTDVAGGWGLGTGWVLAAARVLPVGTPPVVTRRTARTPPPGRSPGLRGRLSSARRTPPRG